MTNMNGSTAPAAAKFKVILAPTEGADSEKDALSVALKLAKANGSNLHLVRVEATPYVIEPIGRRSTDGETNDDRTGGKDELTILAAACRAAARIPIVSAFEKGPVGRTLADYARKAQADLIVMSSHSRGGRKRIALGSVTEYLIRRTNVPVLVVKSHPTFIGPTPAESFSRIVIPLDGSTLSEKILPDAKRLAHVLGSSINLVHVLTPQIYSQEQAAEAFVPDWETDVGTAQDYLNRVAAGLIAEGLTVTTDVLLSDDVAAAILEFAERVGADIIAIATSGSGGMSRFVFGSVADEITRRSSISLFAIHPTGADRQLFDVGESEAHALAVRR